MDAVAYSYDPEIVNTRRFGTGREFNLSKRSERYEYFRFKAGKLIEKLKQFLESHTFIAYLLAPKLAGKGTYLSLLKEVLGQEAFHHISVGDLVREFQKSYVKNQKEYDTYFNKHYRGYIPLKEAIEALLYPDVTSLKPTELILTLIKKKIDSLPRRTIFIDGFPRTEDQISYSLYFRDLINYRDDPDLFVLIHVPLAVIDARIKGRRICPKCGASRHISLLPTEYVAYDKKHKEFYLMCDNPECNRERMVPKQGDNLGIKPLLPRIKRDLKLQKLALKLHGVPHINLYNAVKVSEALKLVEEYEITPEYRYELTASGDIKISTAPWIIEESGEKFYSLLAPPVLLQLLVQLGEIFEL